MERCYSAVKESYRCSTQHFIVEIVNKIILFFYDQITRSKKLVYTMLTMYRYSVKILRKNSVI